MGVWCVQTLSGPSLEETRPPPRPGLTAPGLVLRHRQPRCSAPIDALRHCLEGTRARSHTRARARTDRSGIRAHTEQKQGEFVGRAEPTYPPALPRVPRLCGSCITFLTPPPPQPHPPTPLAGYPEWKHQHESARQSRKTTTDLLPASRRRGGGSGARRAPLLLPASAALSAGSKPAGTAGITEQVGHVWKFYSMWGLFVAESCLRRDTHTHTDLFAFTTN